MAIIQSWYNNSIAQIFRNYQLLLSLYESHKNIKPDKFLKDKKRQTTYIMDSRQQESLRKL